MSTEGAGRPDVTVERMGLVALVEIHRPPHNYTDLHLLATLADLLDGLGGAREAPGGAPAGQAEPPVRAVVLASEGRSFSAGADFSAGGGFDTTRPELASTESVAGTEVAEGTGHPGGGFEDQTRRFYAQALRIFSCPVPMVAAVHGAAVGAGLGLALACDLRVGCTKTWFAASFTRLGIHPGFGTTETLPRVTGAAHAQDMLLTGRRVYGEEAYRFGLLDRLVDTAEEVRAAAIELALELASAAPLAVAATRTTLRAGLVGAVGAAMERELAEQVRLVSTADAMEGIVASLERRDPDFQGR